jgi:hypothetical protein
MQANIAMGAVHTPITEVMPLPRLTIATDLDLAISRDADFCAHD